MMEKCYYYDEDGNRCEGEVGPSFEDFPGMAKQSNSTAIIKCL